MIWCDLPATISSSVRGFFCTFVAKAWNVPRPTTPERGLLVSQHSSLSPTSLLSGSIAAKGSSGVKRSMDPGIFLLSSRRDTCVKKDQREQRAVGFPTTVDPL